MGFEWVQKKNYKRHYVCLKCRKGFKRASEKEIENPVSGDLSNLMEVYYASNVRQDIVKYIQSAHEKLKVVCPNCQNSMQQVHYDFEVPPQRDKNSWRKLEEELSTKGIVQYDTYVHWHRLALQKIETNSMELKRLKQNFTKLEGML